MPSPGKNVTISVILRLLRSERPSRARFFEDGQLRHYLNIGNSSS